MEPEIIIVVLASFVGGGAMGATGMLLSQWVIRKMSPPPQHRLDGVDPRDIEGMKADMADIAVRLHSVDARLDFTEQLLGGALSTPQPPQPLAPPKDSPARAAGVLDSDPHSVEAPSDDEDASLDGPHDSTGGAGSRDDSKSRAADA